MVEATQPRGLRETARVTQHGLQIAAAIDFESWMTMGRRITGISNACAWCLGDWLLYGERVFGERYKTAVTATSLDYQTLRNYAWVARRFEMSRRRDSLSFQHHAEVAALPEPDQDLWLLRAERSRWSRNELRRRLGAERRLQRLQRSEAAVTVSVEVTKSREQRWRQAAQAAQQTLSEWIATAVDAAAEATLVGPPAPVQEPLEHNGSEPALPRSEP
jgi:hypothetical protein